MAFPKFMCSSCDKVIKEHNISVRYYSIDKNLKPIINSLEEEEWLYLVNYYGQYSAEYIKNLKSKFDRIILDNSQAYFMKPIDNIDTLYTCRKFFGVSDGAVLYTDRKLDFEFTLDKSYDRMRFLLGRFEESASAFYQDYIQNNSIFNDEPIKLMSRLTRNLLSGIDYDFIKKRRTDNFEFLHSKLKSINKLNLICPEGPFMYPLLIPNGSTIRKKLQNIYIYIFLRFGQLY